MEIVESLVRQEILSEFSLPLPRERDMLVLFPNKKRCSMIGSIISLVINMLLVLYCYVHPTLGTAGRLIVGTLMLAFWLCSLIGTIGYASTRKKGLGTLALVGFAGFVPIGLIGALSLQKQMRDDGVLVPKLGEGKDEA